MADRNDYSKGHADAQGEETEIVEREVAEAEAAAFAQRNGLLWLGETSCKSDTNNCNDVLRALLERVHLTQTDLVRRGLKYMEDL